MTFFNCIIRTLLVSCIFIFTTQTYCETPTRYTVVRMLQEEDAINWTPYAESAEEKSALFLLLADIVKNPTDLTAAIQNRALVEAGKFAVDPSGNLTDDAKALYDTQINNKIRNSNDTTLRQSLIQSIETAYVPESVEYLTKAAEVDDSEVVNEDSTSLNALDALRAIVAEDEGGRPPLPDTEEFQFYPKTGVPILQRKRSEDWMKAIKQSMQDLEALSRDSHTKKVGIKKIQSIIETQKIALRTAESKSNGGQTGAAAASEKSSAETSLDQSASKKESTKVDSESKESPHLKWSIYLLIASFIFAVLIFSRRWFRSKSSKDDEKKSKNTKKSPPNKSIPPI